MTKQLRVDCSKCGNRFFNSAESIIDNQFVCMKCRYASPMNEVEAAKRFVRVGNGMVIELRNQSELDHLFYHLWDKFDVEHLGAETDDENSWGYVSHYFFSGGTEYQACLDKLSFLSGTGKQVHVMEWENDFMIQVVKP